MPAQKPRTGESRLDSDLSRLLSDRKLSREAKIRKLKSLEADTRLQMIADEENMPDESDSEGERLTQIHAALRKLGVRPEPWTGASKL